ncbi:NAD-glutamate dehydrogenase [Phytophthora cactorum]|nr:NAD-glutamate dehydrogenase [Phytophthora cactorum]
MHSRPLQTSLARAFSAQSDADVEVCEKELLSALDKFQKDAAGNAVPWFLENMPPSYFRSIQEEDRLQHLNAITALVGAEQPEEVDGATLARVKIFTALDDSLGLDIFRFGQQQPFLNKTEEEKLARATIQQFCADIQAGKYAGNDSYPVAGAHFEPEAVDAFLNSSNTMYVQFSHPPTAAPQTMLTMAASNVLPKSFMQKAATYLGLCNLNVVRAHLDVVNKGDGHVAMVRILVQPSEQALKDNFEFEWSKISGNLKYLKWVDDRPVNLTLQHPDLGISRAELIYAYGNMMHGVLAKKDPFAYSLTRIMETLEHEQHLPFASRISDFFLTKFDPQQQQMTDAEQDAIVDEIKADIRRNVEQEDAIELLNTMADAVRGTLRTNKFVRERYALSLRMDPKVLGYGTVGKDTPFGVFFIYGRRFKGFHVRFRDIARGGLRVQPGLRSAAQEQGHPEGGSKAVVLCDPIVGPVGDMAPRDFIIRKSVKAFSDALLDLNTTDEAVKEKIVDYYGQDELIYLGPDENIIPEDIVWMTNRAAYRGYPVPRAFISSKPDAGFNHKVYGVTSEGVAVFADVALRSQNIDPTKQPFTVKITGGTDGDVAGNVIKILHREYGTNLRVVGICDGTGVIEDPQGLDMGELLRLVDESLPLSSFDGSKISSATGVKHDISTAEGIRARQAVVGLIVEGANLFVTPEARQLLFDNAGVVIVKDSSANKCGVVCSSYEIVASMLLETDEFLAVKDELVMEVVDKLRSLARVEAQLLFREYKKDPSSALPPASERISRAITRVHDAVLAHFDNVCEEDQQILFTLIEEHLPPKLRELALHRVHQNVPLAYIRSIVASSLASKIVYREGLQFTEALPESNLGNMALQYLKQEKKVQRLVQDVRESQLPNKDDIADLIARGGVKMDSKQHEQDPASELGKESEESTRGESRSRALESRSSSFSNAYALFCADASVSCCTPSTSGLYIEIDNYLAAGCVFREPRSCREDQVTVKRSATESWTKDESISVRGNSTVACSMPKVCRTHGKSEGMFPTVSVFFPVDFIIDSLLYIHQEETKVREAAEREVRRLKALLDKEASPVVASCRAETQAYVRELKEPSLKHQSAWDKEQVNKIQVTLKLTIEELEEELSRKEEEIQTFRERSQRDRARIKALEDEIRAKDDAQRAAQEARRQLEADLQQAQTEITNELENMQRIHDQAREDRAMRETLEQQLVTLGEVNAALEQRSHALVRRLELSSTVTQECQDLKMQLRDAEVDNETLVQTVCQCVKAFMKKAQVEQQVLELQEDLASLQAQNSLFSEWMLVRNENAIAAQRDAAPDQEYPQHPQQTKHRSALPTSKRKSAWHLEHEYDGDCSSNGNYAFRRVEHDVSPHSRSNMRGRRPASPPKSVLGEHDDEPHYRIPMTNSRSRPGSPESPSSSRQWRSRTPSSPRGTIDVGLHGVDVDPFILGISKKLGFTALSKIFPELIETAKQVPVKEVPESMWVATDSTEIPKAALTHSIQANISRRHAELNEKKQKEYESLSYEEQQKVDAKNEKRATRKRFNRKARI